MKKYLIVILAILLLVGCNVKDTDNSSKNENNKKEEVSNYVTVNLFHWNSCSHCKEEITWLEGLKEKRNNLKINYYEVSEQPELVALIREEFGIDNESVPLTVIGTDYVLGFGGAAKTKIMNLIDQYGEFEYCDLVSLVKNGEETEACYQKNNQN